MVREKKGGRGGRGKMHGQLFCSHKTKNHRNVEIVNPYITLLYLWGLGLINSPLTSCGLLLGSPKTL